MKVTVTVDVADKGRRAIRSQYSEDRKMATRDEVGLWMEVAVMSALGVVLKEYDAGPSSSHRPSTLGWPRLGEV